MFSNRIIKKILVPRSSKPQIKFNDDLLKKILLRSRPQRQSLQQSHSHYSSQKEMMVYNSLNDVPKFFNLEKNINGHQMHIKGKKLENNKYIVRIQNHSMNKDSIKIINMTKAQVKELLNGKLPVKKKSQTKPKKKSQTKPKKKSQTKPKKKSQTKPKKKSQTKPKKKSQTKPKKKSQTKPKKKSQTKPKKK